MLLFHPSTYFVSTDVAFFDTTPFSLSSTVTSQGEDEDLLVYYVSLPVPTPAPIPFKPPITQYTHNAKTPSLKSNTSCFDIRSNLQ